MLITHSCGCCAFRLCPSFAYSLRIFGYNSSDPRRSFSEPPAPLLHNDLVRFLPGFRPLLSIHPSHPSAFIHPCDLMHPCIHTSIDVIYPSIHLISCIHASIISSIHPSISSIHPFHPSIRIACIVSSSRLPFSLNRPPHPHPHLMNTSVALRCFRIRPRPRAAVGDCY